MTLRIIGDDLDPEEVSRLLCCRPTSAQRKGEEIVGKKTGTLRVAKSGSWRFEVSDCENGDLDEQIKGVFRPLSGDITVWRFLASRFKMDLFCGLFMNCSNEGLDVSAESLLALGERGVSLGLNLYGPLENT
ncbi:DUF4279 domain-containing protein [Roseibacillus persicicus]|uniref:DUF4279 domain-containing protein n=1 Tax=Roseibacillus persicicus TaxID=454148 RepID=UPI001E5E9A44|nr:DUF4279 domain-containing protein [Roseibacillus persicicus]